MVITRDGVDLFEVLSEFGWSESDDLEFKSAKGGLPQSLWETYSAMANTAGGFILLGVADSGIVSGVADQNEMRKIFWNTINNRSKVSANILESSDLQVIEYAGKSLITIHIPRASRYQKPIFIGQNPFTGTYKRNYEGDYRCNEREVAHMFSDKSEESVDSRILNKYTLQHLDIDTFHQYRNHFLSYKPNHPWVGINDQSFLIKIGGWKECAQTEQKGVTIAGMLMFGREEVIRDTLPQYCVDYREKYADDPYVRWTDRFTIDGTWSGNLYHFYTKVVQKLFSDLKVPFELDNRLFRKGETVVHEAVREALVNSLIHADYLGQGGVLIEKYKDRFEFSNPGTLLITMDQLLKGNISECRNKTLQTMFTLIGAAEKAGSGVDKIWRGWASQNWREPIIRESVQPDRVLWTLSMIHLLPEESVARLRQRFGSSFPGFTAKEIQVLVAADIEGFVDNERMRQMTSEHPADITKLLQRLVSKGALIKEGRGRWSRYCLGINPLQKDLSSVHLDLSSVHLEELSKLDDISKIAEAAKQRKQVAYSKMEAILIELCQGRWLTGKQLAELLQRNQDALRIRFLSPMVERKLLSMRYSETPNHMNQAYTSSVDHSWKKT